MTEIRLTLDDAPFSGRSVRGVRVAVIDSGVAADHPHIGPPVLPGISLLGHGSDVRDRVGHGTAVAAAIREKAPDAELIPVRVFDTMLNTSADVLGAALRWAADNGAHLINVSMGTPNDARREMLEEALAYVASRGAIVVAAADNHGEAMYPGALNGAIAVRLDPTCERNEIVVSRDAHGGWRVGASGLPRPIPGVPVERNLAGISFAVANVSGFLARLQEGDRDSGAEDLLATIGPAVRM
jgi:subtilisin family serine protease